jgi:hypothetical protein
MSKPDHPPKFQNHFKAVIGYLICIFQHTFLHHNLTITKLFTPLVKLAPSHVFLILESKPAD